MQDDPAYVREAFGAGAKGYVLKEAAMPRSSVRSARSPRAGSMHPALGARLIAAEAEERSSGPRRTRSQIASARFCASLHSATRTRRSPRRSSSRCAPSRHTAHIMQKLRISTRAELVRYALSEGLLEDQAAS